MQQHGLLRPLKAAELSDGTLRYLLWIAALLTPRPPGLLVLNEPETSLHPDLLPALAASSRRRRSARRSGRVARAGADRRAAGTPNATRITLGKKWDKRRWPVRTSTRLAMAGEMTA